MLKYRDNKMTLNIAETTFYEIVNIKKLNYIINNPSKYEAIYRRTREGYEKKR